jgi:hypothetical protein
LSEALWSPLALAAVIAGVAWAAWSGPARDPAVAVDRVDVIAMAVILSGLPWAARRISGPVAGFARARVTRAAGYAAILALVLAKSAVERVADAWDSRSASPAHGPPGCMTGPWPWPSC